MNREEAIISIEEIKDFYGNKNKDGYALEFVALEKEEIEALDMAIKALQVEPVKHGEWTADEKHTEEIYTNPVYCSVCGKDVVMDYGEYAPYCPNCGAKMDRK